MSLLAGINPTVFAFGVVITYPLFVSRHDLPQERLSVVPVQQIQTLHDTLILVSLAQFMWRTASCFLNLSIAFNRLEIVFFLVLLLIVQRILVGSG